jgi:hypothetical protein
MNRFSKFLNERRSKMIRESSTKRRALTRSLVEPQLRQRFPSEPGSSTTPDQHAQQAAWILHGYRTPRTRRIIRDVLGGTKRKSNSGLNESEKMLTRRIDALERSGASSDVLKTLRNRLNFVRGRAAYRKDLRDAVVHGLNHPLDNIPSPQENMNKKVERVSASNRTSPKMFKTGYAAQHSISQNPTRDWTTHQPSKATGRGRIGGLRLKMRLADASRNNQGERA